MQFHNSNVFVSCIIHILYIGCAKLKNNSGAKSFMLTLYIYSTNIGTECFKQGIYSPFFSLQNAVCFIIITCLVPVLFTFYIQGVLKLKNNSGTKSLMLTLHIYLRNIGTECFKQGIYSPFFSLQNAVCFIILTCLVPVLFTFYIQNVLKLKI